jgi:hypothetical protein
MGHTAMIGTLIGSPCYHRPKKGAPLWAHCDDRMFLKRYPADEDFQLEERGLKPCRECWPK